LSNKKAQNLGKNLSVPRLSTENWLLLSFFEGKSQFLELACHQNRVWREQIFEFFGCVQLLSNKKSPEPGKYSSVPRLTTEKWSLLSFFEEKSQFFGLTCRQN
jgi:hypothetical protein